jgi:putative RecB family exonuclease
MSPPRTLSPSKVATFTQCALKFRYTAIDKLPEPPSDAATKGTLVHAALERLFTLDPHERTREAARVCLDQAIDWIRRHDDFTGLGFDDATEQAFFSDAAVLIDNYLTMEDPTLVRAIGIEVMLEVPRDGYALRGIIDRLELGPDDELIVTDYKTGRAPPDRFAQRRMDGVKLYASMCTELLGRRPDRVQLLFLRDRTVVAATPSDQELRGMNRRVDAIWHAVERSCATDDFRPKPSKLCDWCTFKPHCPAFGGDALRPSLTALQA